eukprot:scaffold3330_cov128-Isochrysis_galbana.AAC.12
MRCALSRFASGHPHLLATPQRRRAAFLPGAFLSVKARAFLAVKARAFLSVKARAFLAVKARAFFSVKARAFLSVKARAFLSVKARGFLSVKARAFLSVKARHSAAETRQGRKGPWAWTSAGFISTIALENRAVFDDGSQGSGVCCGRMPRLAAPVRVPKGSESQRPPPPLPETGGAAPILYE